MEPVLFSLPEAACPGAAPATGPSPAGCAPPRLLPSPCAVSSARPGWGSLDRGRPPGARRSNAIFPRRGALSPPGTCWPCGRREPRAPRGAIPAAGSGHGPRGRLSGGAAGELPPPPPPPGERSPLAHLRGHSRRGSARRRSNLPPGDRVSPAQGADSMPWKGRYPRAEGGASRPGSTEHGPRRAARSSRDGAHGRMEWRVEGPRHRSDRPPSVYRSLPVRQVQYRELGLWGTLILLSLFAGAVMASQETWHRNQTLGAASGSMGTASPAPVEKSGREAPSRRHWNGQNVTGQGLSASQLLRAERSPKPKKGSRKSGRGPRSDCRLHSLTVKVRELGLGYDSDEFVRFRYCSGSCQQSRTNYDLSLSRLLEQHAMVPRPHDRPCCRPTRYETFSFMDVNNAWQTASQISASQCGCVG
ncbi:artemin [Elgaria multicarinata webbii]|uniref:artemin n=1 Tax=Elgaria multicarinata webbii TaxID=159646 RepID=UPI002FCCE6DA